MRKEKEKYNKELCQKYLLLMKDLLQEDDVEQGHLEADWLLCDLLCELGYEEIVELYNSVEKWYS